MTHSFDLFAGIAYLENLRQSALLFIALLISISLHEFGHAWMADKCGDPLPRRLGRVTLNPLAHADRFGTLILPGLMIFVPALLGGAPGIIFGWGKPVMISLPNPKTRKRDDVLTTLAGPAMNLLLAILGAALLGVSAGLFGTGTQDAIAPHVRFFSLFLQLNLALMLFNLIPVPPLDGSRLLFNTVKMSQDVFDKISRNAWWILLALILLPSPGNSFLQIVLGPIFGALAKPLLLLAQALESLVLALR